MRTALGKVRGLGSAGSGTAHWWAQRVTAIALVPLTIWFLVSVVALIGSDYATVVSWFQNPFTATFFILLMTAGFYHLKLGLQVIIEDYVHRESTKLLALVTVNFACAGFAVVTILATLRIFLSGSPL